MSMSGRTCTGCGRRCWREDAVDPLGKCVDCWWEIANNIRPHPRPGRFRCERCDDDFPTYRETPPRVCVACSTVQARWSATTRRCPYCNLRYRPERRSQQRCGEPTCTEPNRIRGARSERMRIARLKGTHSEREWQLRCWQWGDRCAYCGGKAPLQKDHRTPISRGGSDAIENIVPACASCNSAKKDQLPELWPLRSPRYADPIPALLPLVGR